MESATATHPHPASAMRGLTFGRMGISFGFPSPSLSQIGNRRRGHNHDSAGIRGSANLLDKIARQLAVFFTHTQPVVPQPSTRDSCRAAAKFAVARVV